MTEVFLFIIMLICCVELMIIILLCKDLKKQSDRADESQKELLKIKTEKYFHEKKQDIMQEVFEDAKEQKKAICAGSDSQRYNAASAILHDNKRN